MKQHQLKIQRLCLMGLMTAVMAVMAQIAIPMPIGVPITLQTLAVSLAGILLGSRYGVLSTIIYMLLGIVGFPVFANFTGGWQRFFGPTGGFLLSFPLVAYFSGMGMELRAKYKWAYPLGILLGTASSYFWGTLVFSRLTNVSFLTGFVTCCLPFLPAEILKFFMTCLTGLQMKRRLQTFL